MLFTITRWNNEIVNVEANTITAAFELNFGGPVTDSGYNNSGAWFASEFSGKGHVFNNNGDHCATIVVKDCKHWNCLEIGLLDSCNFGCKRIQCEKCGDEFDSHRSIYGCSLNKDEICMLCTGPLIAGVCSECITPN